MAADDASPQQLSKVLADELLATRGSLYDAEGRPISDLLGEALDEAARQGREQERDPALKDAAEERARRRLIYAWERQLDLSALCLSGGGIRSASISLGVIQALADKGLLREFDYLSTVSGGGYIGSWLSAWLHHAGDANVVIAGLRQQRDDPDCEPPPLSHLRRYSNYLTPQLGMLSADTWAAGAIVLRNLMVNWLILVPAIAVPVIAVKFAASMLIRDLHPSDADAPVLVAGLCVVFGWLAFGYKLHRLYISGAGRNTEVAQTRFIWCSLVPAVAAGFCFVWLLVRGRTPVNFLISPWLGVEQPSQSWIAIASFAVVVFIGGLAVAVVDRKLSRAGQSASDAGPAGPAAEGTDREAAQITRWWHSDLFRAGLNGAAWLAGVLVFATLIWAGAQLIGDGQQTVTLIKDLCITDVRNCVADAHKHSVDVNIDRRLLVVIFGMPWFLLATISAHSVYLLLRSGSGTGDVEREWLGRASGWHFIAGFGWIVLSAIVLLGPDIYYTRHVLGENAGAWLTALTGAFGSVTAFLGKSGLTPAKGGASGTVSIGSNVALAIAGSVFAVLLLIMISLLVDWPIAGRGLACFPADDGAVCSAGAWGLCFLCLLAVLLPADAFANVNRFSIHALYRNRLVREFLGGGRAPNRKPDGFTDFDWGDNIRMATLWDPDRPVDRNRNWRPFHVVNMTLNLAATKNLAWQQRKAASFIATPLYCGSAELGLGYRRTELYGGPVERPVGPHETGITLGTAMAISGAAVSSNMGYHSSPALSFLLTLFNVRLGWWLGNPGPAGDRHLLGSKAPYEREGPFFALRPLLSELFGLTSDESPYVYLSDGGHFEDLGLYEMVRRRCRWIVVCDADQDKTRGFEDLGNAVRKIWIDLGVRITFADAPLLQAAADAKPVQIPYFALGTIDYINEPNPNVGPGKILYIKPAVRGDEEAAEVIAYKRANPDFPAQSAGDQWFDEAQLEAHRRLGYLMAARIIDAVRATGAGASLAGLFDGLEGINHATMGPR
jgi:hypothetical protein